MPRFCLARLAAVCFFCSLFFTPASAPAQSNEWNDIAELERIMVERDFVRFAQTLPKLRFNGRDLLGVTNAQLNVMLLFASKNLELAEFDIIASGKRVLGSEGKFAPELELSSSYAKSSGFTSIGSGNNDTLNYSLRDTLSLGGKLSKLYESGNRLTISYDHSIINPQTLSIDDLGAGSANATAGESYASSSLGFAYVIPFMKGGGDVNLYDRRSAELSRSGNRLNKDLVLKSSLSGGIDLFWAIVSAFEELKLLSESVELANATLEQLKIRADLGDVPGIEVTQAENLLNLRKQELENGQLAYINFEAVIKDAVDMKNVPLGLFPIFEEELPNPDFSEAGEKNYGELVLANSVDIRVRHNELSELRLQEKNQLNAAKPSLDLSLNYTLQGHGSGFADPYAGYANPDIHGYSVGVTYRAPWGDDGSAENLAAVRVGIAKKMKEINNQKDTLLIQLGERLRSLKSRFIFLENAAKQIKLRQELLDQENDKFNLGSSTQLALDQARVNLILAKKDRILVYSSLRKDFENFQVFVGEHPVLKNLPEKFRNPDY